MFTGLIEEVGRVLEARHDEGSLQISVGCETVLEGTKPGDSIAVDGCCLTVTELGTKSFSALATQETLSLTTLGDFTVGRGVNLERSLTLAARLGGHIVQGHVDGTGRVKEIRAEGDSERWVFSIPTELRKFLVMKGSVAINGVSLTVAGLGADWLSVALIPKTLELTTFGTMKVDDRVNLEMDVMGKYIFQYMEEFRKAGVGG